jgi:hypothetical protein
MFGLEKQKEGKGKGGEFFFDLEKRVQSPKEARTLKKEIEEKIGKVKQVLRSGENKEQFDQMGQLLHGYASLLRVTGRIKTE